MIGIMAQKQSLKSTKQSLYITLYFVPCVYGYLALNDANQLYHKKAQED